MCALPLRNVIPDLENERLAQRRGRRVGATGLPHTLMTLDPPLSYGRIASALILAAVLFAPGVTLALPEQAPLPGTRFEMWQGFTEFESLNDGSTLAEYLGETASLSPGGYRLRVSFMPRFGCEPVISILASLAPPGGERRTLAGIVPTGFTIDGNELDLPVVIDDEGDFGRIYHEAPTELARALREQIDIGNRAFLRDEEGRTVAFSLFGSKRSLAEVQRRCRQHEPDDS